jgi:hypothetical protein
MKNLILYTFFYSSFLMSDINMNTNVSECMKSQIMNILSLEESKNERFVSFNESKDDEAIKVLLKELFPNNSTGESYTLQQLDKAWEWDRANGMKFIYKLLDLMNRNYSIESVESHLIDRYISRAQTICSPK